jgi:hypothetical protein
MEGASSIETYPLEIGGTMTQGSRKLRKVYLTELSGVQGNLTLPVARSVSHVASNLDCDDQTCCCSGAANKMGGAEGETEKGSV